MALAPDAVPGPSALLAAAERLDGWARRTPTIVADLPRPVVLKLESLQHTGSFKARGAANALLARRDRGKPSRPVAAISAGNHAQGLALAARALGVEATVVMPADTAAVKVEAARALGARVVTDGVTLANREEVLARLVAEEDLDVVHPFDDWDVIAGQATATMELLTDDPDVDVVVVPIGGGGLAAGAALSIRAFAPGVRLVGVEPEAADDARRSLVAGRRVSHPSGPTIADGARVSEIGARPAEVLIGTGLLHDVVTVDDRQLGAAWAELATRAHVWAEPTAALPWAAVRAGLVEARRPGLVVTGGNTSAPAMAALLSQPASAHGGG